MPIRRTPVALATISLAAIVLLGCAQEASDPDIRTDSPTEIDDLAYSSADGAELLLNACLPAATKQPTGAVLLIHGGGFEKGGRNAESMMGLCQELSAVGLAGFSIDYRLAPAATYPAQVDDVGAAVTWLRNADQADRFGIDPAKVGLFGSSAGAIMAASVGTAGSGSLAEGARVAAVIALSPASDLTAAGLSLGSPSSQEIQLVSQYLGCDDLDQCADAKDASPLYSVDASDPPFYIAISHDEIVPVEQGRALRDALQSAGVDVVYDEQPGSDHALSMLDTSMKADILRFLHEALG